MLYGEYGIVQLMEMDTEELRAFVLRYARRLNRQISRAQKAGKQLGRLFKVDETGKVKRPSQREKAYANKTHGELVTMYAEMNKESKGGYTLANIEALEKQRAEFAEALGVSTEDMTEEDFTSLLKAQQRAESEAGAFYQVLVKANEVGVADDFTYFRTDARYAKMTETAEGRKAFMKEQITAINKAIKESNKQRLLNGDEKQEKLYNITKARKAALKGERSQLTKAIRQTKRRMAKRK